MTMIPRTELSVQTVSWQQALTDVVKDPRELLELLELDPTLLPGAQAASAQFPLRVPRPYLARMERGNPHDPLLRQVLPLDAETRHTPGFVTDPLGERYSNQQPGVIHKYQGRVLLVVAGACAVNCRYCFRRHFPYGDNALGGMALEQALAYLAARPDISEVIYSGGDPLAASDQRLRQLTRRLEAIPHLKRLRIHTRLPLVIPQRVDAALLDWLAESRLDKVMVLHANHANELDASVQEKLAQLRASGVTLLNQAVLLRGVNDDIDSLQALSERLFAAGVLPYYLHLLDRVQGAAHFEVTETTARRLLGELMQRLPGYLVPKLVREDAGAPSKTPLSALWP